MPVRLGRDAFLEHRISKVKAEQLITSMQGFKHLMAAYAPLDVMACATSVMRTAENGLQICREIRQKTGIAVNIISGKREAEIDRIYVPILGLADGMVHILYQKYRLF